MSNNITLGTRGSALARWQTDHVWHLLAATWPDLKARVQVLSTRGDNLLDTPLPLIGGKGLFTAELEAALHSGLIDVAVHSLKDVPTEMPLGLTIGAVPSRTDPSDVLVSRQGFLLDTLPIGAVVGTSSRRRASQLLARRSDLQLVDIRGNLQTRITKALDPAGPFDAIVLAYAGLERLGQLNMISEVLPAQVMLPAPGQGALAVQCRDDAASRALVAPINHRETELAVAAERGFLAGLGGGCSVPIAAFASITGNHLFLQGRIVALDGKTQVDVAGFTCLNADTENLAIAQQAGHALAQDALERGASMLLEAVSL